METLGTSMVGDIMFHLIKVFLFSPRISLDTEEVQELGQLLLLSRKDLKVSKKADEKKPRHTK